MSHPPAPPELLNIIPQQKASEAAHVFDFADATWTALPQIPTPRSAPRLVECSDKLYLIGGESWNSWHWNWHPFQGWRRKWHPFLDMVEVFDPAKGQWSQLPRMPTARGSQTEKFVAITDP